MTATSRRKRRPRSPQPMRCTATPLISIVFRCGKARAGTRPTTARKAHAPEQPLLTPPPAPRLPSCRSPPVVSGRGVGRPDEQVRGTTLAAADPNAADMATLLIVGSAETHVIVRPGLLPLVYTSRSAQGTSA